MKKPFWNSKPRNISLAPPVILFFLGGLFVVTFIFNHPVYLALFLFLFFVFILLVDRFSESIVYLRFSLFIALLILLMNIIFIPTGETILFELNTDLPLLRNWKFTKEGLYSSTISFIRLMLVILVFGILNSLIRPEDMMQSMVKLHLPYSLIIMITLSMQFFPILMQDLDRLKKIQKSQGIQIDSGPWITRIRNRISLILPLLTNSLERSIQISEALESRGFGLKQKRSYYKPIQFKWQDIAIICIIFTFLSVAIIVAIQGNGYFEVYPQVQALQLSRMDGIYLSSFTFFFFIIYFIIYILGDQHD